jgi:hypothetical protein
MFNCFCTFYSQVTSLPFLSLDVVFCSKHLKHPWTRNKTHMFHCLMPNVYVSWNLISEWFCHMSCGCRPQHRNKVRGKYKLENIIEEFFNTVGNLCTGTVCIRFRQEETRYEEGCFSCSTFGCKWQVWHFSCYREQLIDHVIACLDVTWPCYVLLIAPRKLSCRIKDINVILCTINENWSVIVLVMYRTQMTIWQLIDIL